MQREVCLQRHINEAARPAMISRGCWVHAVTHAPSGLHRVHIGGGGAACGSQAHGSLPVGVLGWQVLSVIMPHRAGGWQAVKLGVALVAGTLGACKRDRRIYQHSC